MSASVCLDPASATERLGHWLDPKCFDPGVMRVRSNQVLDALAANGLRAGEIAGFPSRRPRDWVNADPRWVPLLMGLRGHADPNVSRPARTALGHADRELVAASQPKASKKKKGTALTLRPIGRAAFVEGTYWGDPVFVAEGRVALFSTLGRLEVRRLAEGFPVAFAFDLPAGLELPTERRDPNDDGWDRGGVHGVAVHPSRDVIAISSFSTDADLGGVLLVDATGAIVARRPMEDLLAHRLHWGADAKTLWVMAQEDTNVVIALDPETLEERGRCGLGEFPPPAFPSVLRHPTDDVGCFQILCGQDGFWVKCVENAGKRYRVRAQALSAVHHEVVVYGFGENGNAVVTPLESKLVLRDWPTLKTRKAKNLAGPARGAAGTRTSVIVPSATVGNAADGFEVFRLPDGEKVGAGEWPEGHVLQDAFDDFVVTTNGNEVHAWKLGP